MKPITEFLDQSNGVEHNVVERFAENDATMLFGCRPGYDPDAYVRKLHHPDEFGEGCNYLHPPGTFDWVEEIDEANREFAQLEEEIRKSEMYVDLWKKVIESAGTIYLLYSLSLFVSRRHAMNSGPPSSDPDFRLQTMM